MCVIAACSANQTPRDQDLRQACRSNPDGFGWAISLRDRILRGHTMRAEVAIDQFLTMREEHPEGAALFHARIATRGRVDITGCHPFAVHGSNGNVVLAHNGTRREVITNPNDWRSDSRIMAEETVPNYGGIEEVLKEIDEWEKWLGAANKIVMLRTGEFFSMPVILNRKQGEVQKETGIWWSNGSFRYQRSRSYASSYTSAYSYADWPKTEHVDWKKRAEEANRAADEARESLSAVMNGKPTTSAKSTAKSTKPAAIYRMVDGKMVKEDSEEDWWARQPLDPCGMCKVPVTVRNFYRGWYLCAACKADAEKIPYKESIMQFCGGCRTWVRQGEVKRYGDEHLCDWCRAERADIEAEAPEPAPPLPYPDLDAMIAAPDDELDAYCAQAREALSRAATVADILAAS